MIEGNYFNDTLPPFLQTKPPYGIFDARCNDFAEPLPDWCSLPPTGTGQCAQHLTWCWNVKIFSPSPSPSPRPSPSPSPAPSPLMTTDSAPVRTWILPAIIIIALIATLALSCIISIVYLVIRRKRRAAAQGGAGGGSYEVWSSLIEGPRARGGSGVDDEAQSSRLSEGFELRKMADDSFHFDASEVMVRLPLTLRKKP